MSTASLHNHIGHNLKQQGVLADPENPEMGMGHPENPENRLLNYPRTLKMQSV